jgi:methionyl-tRNA formyltransferase
MGTPALAARVLESLIAGGQHDLAVVGVVTRPDQPRKRGLKLEPSEVATVAAQHGIRTLKPVKIRTAEFLDELRSFAPDVIVVAAYGRILPQGVLELALPLNVHASLLPRHRGAAPIEGSLLAGDTITGVTIMRVTAQMDAGPIVLQRSIPVADDETQGSLKKKLAVLGADAMLEAFRRLRTDALPEMPQDEKAATYTVPVKKEDSVIDWRSAAVLIERMVRAYNPWPVARTSTGGADLLLWRARVAPPVSGATAQPGTLVATKPVPVVGCGDGFLELLEVQAPGRRRMPAADFLRGRQLAIGARFGT